MPLTHRLAVCALMLLAMPARAADFDRPYPPPGQAQDDRAQDDRAQDSYARDGRGHDGSEYDGHAYDGSGHEPAPRPEPGFRGPPRLGAGPRFERGPGPGSPETCRTFVRRGLDAEGEPVLRRVRVCDEAVVEGDPPPPPENIPPRRRFDPRW